MASDHLGGEKASVHSELDDIKGVGPAKRNKLLLSFSSIKKIKNATVGELSAVIDPQTARNVYKYFHPEN